jgi:chromosome segregation ATPase
LTDRYKELKKKMGRLKETHSVYTGTLEEKKKQRDACYDELRELGVKKPQDPEARAAYIRKRKQELLRTIKSKEKEVDDACSRFDELDEDTE